MTQTNAVFPILSKWQRSVWAHQDLWWMLFGGRRTTKSLVSWMRGLQDCLHGKIAAWYCADKTLADENWQDICDFAQPWASRINRHTEGEIWFENSQYGKGVFKRRSGYNKYAGRSGTVNLLTFDELQLIDKGTFSRALPSILTTRGAVSATLTAPEGPEEFHKSAWIKKIIDSAGKDGIPRDKQYRRWYVTKKPTEAFDIAFVFMMTDINLGVTDRSTLQFYEDNISYDPVRGYSQKGKNKTWSDYLKQAIDALDDEADNLTEEEFEREMNLEWSLSTSDLVFGKAKDGIVRNESWGYVPDAPVYWFIDRGEGRGYHVLLMVNHIHVGDRKKINRFDPDTAPEIVPIYAYQVFDEIATKSVISEGAMINNGLTMAKQKGYALPKLVIYDVRAPGYRREILDAGLTPSARNVPIDDGIRKILRLIEKGLLRVHPRAERLWQNLTNYARDAAGYPIEDKDNDAADALRYGVWVVDALHGIVNETSAENKEITESIVAEKDKREEDETIGAMMLYF